MDRHLITGVAGHIGSNLAKYLLKSENNIVIGIDNFSNSDFSSISNILTNPNFIFYEKNIDKNINLSVDNIFHLTGSGDLKAYRENKYNYIFEELENLNIILDYAKLSGAQLFLFSSIETHDIEYNKFIELYDILSLNYADLYKINLKIIKIDYAIGENFSINDIRAIPKGINKCLNNLDINMPTDYYMSPISITDVLKLINYLMTNYTDEKIIYLNPKYPVLISQLLRKIIFKTNSSSSLNFDSFDVKSVDEFQRNTINIELEDIDIALDKAIDYLRVKQSK